MAATVLLDRLRGAELENGVGVRRHIRTAFVYGISISAVGTADPNVLVKALSSGGMPQLGDAHPSGDGTKVIYHHVTPAGQDQCWVEIHYSSGDLSTAQADFSIEDSISGQMIETQLIPGKDGEPVRVSYRNPADASDATPPMSCRISYYQPMRTIVASCRYVGRQVLNALGEAAGHVNAKPWGGKDVGFWLVKGVHSVDLNNTGEVYSARVEIISKNFEDWSSYPHLEREGLPVPLDEKAVLGIKRPKYKYGKIAQTEGMVRVGPYPVIDFSSRLPMLAKLSDAGGFITLNNKRNLGTGF